MKHSLKIAVRNSSEKTKILCLEPWAEEFEMLPNTSFDILAKSDYKGDFEIDFGENTITVYAWWNSIVEVLCEGENICNSGHIQLPGPMNKVSLSNTIKVLFGKEKR